MPHEGTPKANRDNPYSDEAVEASRRKIEATTRAPRESGETEPQEPKPEFGERANALIEARRAHAESSAMFGDDEELADTLRVYLKTKHDMEGRTWEGGHVSDEKREDSPEELARKRAIIDSLTLQPDGTLSREGTEIIDDFRRMTREVVAEVLEGDTAGLSEADAAKYRRLGENFVAEPQDKQPDEPPTKAETLDSPLSKEQLETKEGIDKILAVEDAKVDNARQRGATHARLIKPMIDALKIMSGNDEDELLQLVGSLVRRVNLLAGGKYKDEGQFAVGRATREIYETNFSDSDKRALDEAIEVEVQRQKRESGGGALKTSPPIVFDTFIKQLSAAKSR